MCFCHHSWRQTVSRQIQNHMRMQRVGVDTLVRHAGGKPKEHLMQGSRIFTPASTDDTVRTPSYTPLRGLVTGAEMLSSGMCRFQWIQSCQAASCYDCTHVHSYRILQTLWVSCSVTSLFVSFAHLHKSEL